MATKTVLKKTRQQAVVKVVGSGAVTILNTDVALADETLDSNGNVLMNINGVYYAIAGATAATIARSGTTVMELIGNDNWSFSQNMGFVDNQLTSSNITVTLAGAGTVFLNITKARGFYSPNYQELKDYQKI